MDDRARYRFWRAVEECLVQIHNLERPVAQKKVLEFQKNLAEGPEGLMYEMAFHFEPFDLACELIGKKVDLPLEEYREKYLHQILNLAS